MADNVLETVQKLVQDVIAPDVRELKARLSGFEQRVDDRFSAVDDKLKSLDQRMDDRFKAVEQRMDDKFDAVNAKFDKVLAAIASMKTENELLAVREVSSLRERVAVLEMQQKQNNRAA